MCERASPREFRRRSDRLLLPRQSATRDIASEVSLGRLGMLYNRDPAQLDEVLAEASRNLLPHVDRPDSTLHSLDHD